MGKGSTDAPSLPLKNASDPPRVAASVAADTERPSSEGAEPPPYRTLPRRRLPLVNLNVWGVLLDPSYCSGPRPPYVL